MKIYQIYESGGEYEDRYDNLIHSYLHKEKAESKKSELENERNDNMEAYYKCCKCPIFTLHLTKRKYNSNKLIIDDYCSHPDIEYDGNYIYCNNLITNDYYIDSTYRIEEVYVEE